MELISSFRCILRVELYEIQKIMIMPFVFLFYLAPEIFLLHFVTYFVNFSNRWLKSRAFLLKAMKIKWKQLVFKIGVWIALEVFFSYVGVDTIADYSEYIFDRSMIASIS